MNWLIVEMIFDTIFLADIFINFNTAYYEKYDLVVSRPKIFKKYLAGWLITDLIASFPFSLLSILTSSNDPNNGKFIKIAKFPRVYRIIRILRLIKVIKTVKFMQ